MARALPAPGCRRRAGAHAVSAPRVGLVGARRRRQGLGPFVARFLREAGALVPCFLVTSRETRAAAVRQLEEHAGAGARGYLELEAMLEAERLDALAILSPADTHRAHLEAALSAGLHVLCEKPFVWGEDDLAGVAARITAGFEERGLLLHENCQWPYTLPAFEALYPGSRKEPPREFAMRLQPAARGRPMLGDCLPHVLSLLQALAPGPAAIEASRFSSVVPDAPEIDVAFDYRTDRARIRVQVALASRPTQPREAGYAIDGRPVRRVVNPEGYRLSFAAEGRMEPLVDPLGLLVADFVQDLRALSTPGDVRERSQSREIAERMRLLASLVAAYDASASESTATPGDPA